MVFNGCLMACLLFLTVVFSFYQRSFCWNFFFFFLLFLSVHDAVELHCRVRVRCASSSLSKFYSLPSPPRKEVTDTCMFQTFSSTDRPICQACWWSNCLTFIKVRGFLSSAMLKLDLGWKTCHWSLDWMSHPLPSENFCSRSLF